MKKQRISLKTRALIFLSKREYSQYELKKKLKRYLDDAQSEDDIERLIIELKENNWLNNERFAESVIRRRQSQRGNAQILMELKQHQIAPDSISEKLCVLEENEYERAYAIWQKKFGQINDELSSLFDIPENNVKNIDHDSISAHEKCSFQKTSVNPHTHYDYDSKISRFQNHRFSNRTKTLQSRWSTSSKDNIEKNKKDSAVLKHSNDENSNKILKTRLLLNKQWRFLASRGFSTETIQQVLKTVSLDKNK